jgi:hypothetical protein
VILLLASGCGSFGLDDGSSKPTEEEGGLVIEGIDPSWGPPDEDTEVAITGVGMDSATAVYFGRAEVPLTRIDEETIVATAPAVGFETVVSVRVVGDDGEDEVEDGFTYSEDAPPDTDADTDTDTDADTDADADNSGKTGGLVQVSLVQYACPDCIGATTDIAVTAQAAFHEPTRPKAAVSPTPPSPPRRAASSTPGTGCTSRRAAVRWASRPRRTTSSRRTAWTSPTSSGTPRTTSR